MNQFVRRVIPILLLVLAVCVVQTPDAQAQVIYGSIIGQVRDSTGAAIPGAEITATQLETNTVYSAISNDAGAYSLPTLRPGRYSLKVVMPGFKEYIQTDIPVTLNNVTRVNVALQVGEITESITVTSQTAILQTDRAEVRAEMTEEKFENLPVPLGRNYQQLYKTLPGFTPPGEAHSIQTNPSRSLTFNVNGVSNQINNTKIDGVASTNPWLPHLTGYVPSLEAIQTVNVVSNSFDAEQGMAGGAAVTVALKSGTNDFRGSAFYYFADHNMKAKRYIFPYPDGLGKPKAIYNQAGATYGGPIVRDRLFFFTSYEGTFDHRFASRIDSIPSLKTRAGDFSGFSQILYDPATGNPDGSGRLPFAGNIIPANRFDPISKKLLDLLPAPNQAGSNLEQNNYYAEAGFSFDRHTLDTKIDFNLTHNINMFGRFSYLDYKVVQPSLFGDALVGPGLDAGGAYSGNVGTGNGNSYNFSTGANYIMTPTFLMDGYFGFARFITDSRQPRYGENVGLELGIPGTNGSDVHQSGMPHFDLNGYQDLGSTENFMPYYRSDDQWQYVWNANWTKGTHELRFGVDFNRQDMNHVQPEMVGGAGTGSRGRFWFGSGPTRLCTNPTGTGGCSSLSPTIDRFSLASFILGLHTQTGKLALTEFPYSTRNWLTAMYVRDRWQISPKLTMSVGLRWEYYPMPTREDRGMELYDPSNNTMRIGGVGDVPKDLGVNMSKAQFAPRLGFAYRFTDDFVIRAGYGITNDPYPLARPLRTNYPLLIEVVQPAPNDWTPAGTLAGGIPAIVTPNYGNGIIPVPGNYTAFLIQNPEFKRGYVQSWNLTVQKELGWGFVGELGYVATRQIRQVGFVELNYSDLNGGTAGRKLNQKFGRTADTRLVTPIGGTKYDSLQAKVNRRFAAGYSMDVSYTWGKSLTNSGQSNSDGTLAINIPEYYHLLKSVSGFDRTHNLSVSTIIEMPFGRGRRWGGDSPAILNAILGGWQLNTIISTYSQTPFTIGASGVNAPGSGNRANQVKENVEKLGNIGRGTKYFDPTAFADVTNRTFGNSGFNILRGPAIFNWDFGLFKQFIITEGIDLQLRMESFNFTNTPKYNNPNGSVTSGDFMSITGGSGERQFRVGLRLGF